MKKLLLLSALFIFACSSDDGSDEQNDSIIGTSDRFYSDTDGYPFPIKIKVSSPDEDAFEDADVVLELLTQVYQFSRLYWKSLRQQNVPITIKYPEMVAQIAPRFNNGVPDDAKDALWFL